MIRMIEPRHVPDGVLDGSGVDENDTLVVSERVKRLRVLGPVRVRALIVPESVEITFYGGLVVGQNVTGPLVLMGGAEAPALQAAGSVLALGRLRLGPGRSVIRGDLLISGDLEASGDVVVADGCCRITGTIAGEGVLACDDVWAPALRARSSSPAQRAAAERLRTVAPRSSVGDRLRRLMWAY